VLDLTQLLQQVRDTQQPIQLTEKYYQKVLKEKMKGPKLEFMKEDNTFWVTTKGKKGEDIKLRLDIRIFPGSIAEKNPVGDGRNEPNMEPHLPPPIGRIAFSLNPFTMLGQLVNKAYLAKLYKILCVLVCLACCIALAPMIVSNIFSMLILKIFGLK
jgi:hypothetical protein